MYIGSTNAIHKMCEFTNEINNDIDYNWKVKWLKIRFNPNQFCLWNIYFRLRIPADWKNEYRLKNIFFFSNFMLLNFTNKMIDKFFT
jgi:hypothetical protein